MAYSTITFTQDTMFQIFKQSAIKYGLNGSAKIFVTDKDGVLETQHIAPEPIEAPSVTAMEALKAMNEDLHNMD